MSFRLPKYADLTDQQRTVLNCSYGKNMVVSAAPGTGKTVIALYRASDLVKGGKKILMLVYNNPLKQYLSSAVTSLGISAEVNTYFSWLWNLYNDRFDKKPPVYDENSWEYKWPEIKNDFKKIGIIYDCIIIDEAQDFPIQLIECLAMISKTVSCFMDPNQTIFNSYTRVEDVNIALRVRTNYTLYDNFRNPKEIFEYAKLFNPDNTVAAVRSTGEKPYLIKCSKENELSKIVEIINMNYGLNYIGIFTDRDNQKRIFDYLSEKVENIDVYMYVSKDKEYKHLNFDKTGIYVLSFNCMKGLEFDAVIIPNCDRIQSRRDTQIKKNIYYVAITRASEKFYGLYESRIAKQGCIDIFTPLSGKESLITWRE